MKKPLLLFLFFVLSAAGIIAQTGAISGKVTDKLTGEELVGAAVKIKGTSIGAVTDFSGDFQIRIAPGTYTIEISYLAYTTQEITGVVVTADKITTLSVAMEEKIIEVEGAVVEAKFKESSQTGLILEQKNSIRVSDGISYDALRTAPVSNSGDILKKISGASLQGGKFAVIRGLNDRYNTAYINGAPLPSTEPDRRAFSFDIIPAGMLDRMVIYKTATPDMPGDFSGGLIQLTTRDFPEMNFYNVSFSGGYNTIATFKDFAAYQGGKRDWLGLDDGTRQLPEGLTTNPANNNIVQNPENTNKFFNKYGTTVSAAAPNTSFQYSMGLVKRMSNDNSRMLSAVVGLTYSNSRRFAEVERQFRLPVSADNQLLDSMQDKVYTSEVLWGAIGNISFKINNRNRISWKNLYNVNSEDQVTQRNRADIANSLDKKLESYYYIQNNIYSTQLSGDHALNWNKLKIEWVLGANTIKRLVPDYRTMQYVKVMGDPDSNYTTSVGPTPNVEFGGRFFSELNENLKSARVDASMPLIDNNKGRVFKKMEIKAGISLQARQRDFAARFMGWVTGMTFGNPKLRLPLDQIFNPENTQSFNNGFLLSDQTNPNDKYDASSKLSAGYIMFDNKLGNRFRLVWGARYEMFNQKLQAVNNSKTPVNVDNNFNDLLPSANLVYELNSKSNLRASFSKTVSRPEFRELAPFSFFDFNTFTIVTGNDSLKRATVKNYDLRYEHYIGRGGEMISVSGFYKEFTNPIESIIQIIGGAGSYNSSFQNVPKAVNYGAELEMRRNLSFINKRSGFLNNSQIFGNLAYIISEVDLSGVASQTNKKRPLQGQSNYIINMGLQLTDTATDITAGLNVNRVGRRIAIVGTGDGGLFPDVWENPRTVIDFQISKKWGKKGKLETKLSISDILAQPLIYYMDRKNVVDENNTTATPDITGHNKHGKFDGRSKDVLVSRTTFGRTITIGVAYKF